VSLHTLDFIESQGQGTTMTPRLAGFLNTDDRRFFELFTTCKGIGNRRGLRALTLATGQIAAAIVDRDVAMLQSLPEIGKRTAETIIATLHGKVDNFAAVAAARTTEGETGSESGRSGGKAAEALEVLLQLGENRIQAMTWIDQALRDDEQPQDTRDLINRVYRIKAGA